MLIFSKSGKQEIAEHLGVDKVSPNGDHILIWDTPQQDVGRKATNKEVDTILDLIIKWIDIGIAMEVSHRPLSNLKEDWYGQKVLIINPHKRR